MGCFSHFSDKDIIAYKGIISSSVQLLVYGTPVYLYLYIVSSFYVLSNMSIGVRIKHKQSALNPSTITVLLETCKITGESPSCVFRSAS